MGTARRHTPQEAPASHGKGVGLVVVVGVMVGALVVGLLVVGVMVGAIVVGETVGERVVGVICGGVRGERRRGGAKGP